MKRSRYTVLLLIALLAVVVTANSSAWAQVPESPQPPPSQDSPPDSLAAAGADSVEINGQMVGAPVAISNDINAFQNVGPGTRPRVADQEPEFHPVYKLTYRREEEIGTWGHDFTLNYQLSDRLRFNSSADITIKENDVLNRENRQESWRAGLNYNLTSAVGMAVKFNRSYQIDTRNAGEAGEVTSSREKETMDFSTDYRKTHFSGLSTSLSASAGIERNDYSDIQSNGTTQNVSASLGYEIVEGLESNFGYTGRHSVLDSRQGDFESTDESISHALDTDFTYEWDQHALSANARRSYSQTQYPKEEQTEEREQESESLGVTTDFRPLENLGIDFNFDYSRNQSYYAIETTKDSDVKSRSVGAGVDYKLNGTVFSAKLSSKTDRSNQFSIQTGDTYSDSFGGSVSHSFGSKVSLSFRGSVSLVSYHYDDPEANDQDRDLMNQEASLTLDYKPRSDIAADILLRVKESQLIYIRTTRSGDNKKTNTYTIQPSIKKTFSPNVAVSQKYELSADYTFYTFDRDANFLIRNFGVTTNLDWRMFGGVNTTFEHRYRGQDEGSYTEGDDGIERYGKSSERDDHTLSIMVRYKLFDLIDLEVKQDYSVQAKWVFEGSTRRLSWEKHDTSLQGKASMNHDLENGTTVRLSVSRTLRDAPNITERQEDVWNASVSLERTF